MKLRVLGVLSAGLAVMLFGSSYAFASQAWKVSDLSGEVSIGRGHERHAATIGTDIAYRDELTIGDGRWIELVSKGTCEVWELKGAGNFSFGEHGIVTGPDLKVVPPDHRLAVCFDPSGFSTEKARRIGGIIERGGSPEDELIQAGSQSNAALINLIILNAFSDKDVEKARPYYEALKKRAPDSKFIASVAEIFEAKTPQ